MSASVSVAATLSPDTRKAIGVQVLAQSEPVSHIALAHQVSRKFVYQQGDKAQQALDESFAPHATDTDVLFYLPVTKAWIFQLILGLVLICHSSYRGVVELLRDVFDWPISLGTVANRVESAATAATQINEAQDLSGIRVGLHDEIYQGSQPVLAGVDAASTYCYLLAAAEQRDEQSWAWHLLDPIEQGFDPDYTIADGAKGLRAGQAIVMPQTPCHGDVFHILHQFEQVANSLKRKAQGATTQRLKLEERLAKFHSTTQMARSLRGKLVHAQRRERKLKALSTDVTTVLHWMSHDVLELAGPVLSIRQELFDFIVDELQEREHNDHPAIRTLRIALSNQRDELLAFAGILDNKLTAIAQRFEVSLQAVRDVCLLQRKSPTANAYWQRWTQLHAQLSHQFHEVMEAVMEALKHTPRASSLVENLNSRRRNYFFLRRQLGDNYLNLLQFFLNHRCFMRSQVPERVGKSPTELMSGEAHSHWLELLGFTRFQRA